MTAWCQHCSTNIPHDELEEDWQGEPTCPNCGTRVKPRNSQ